MSDRLRCYLSLALACHLAISKLCANFEIQVQGCSKCFLFSPFMGSNDTMSLWGLSSIADGLWWSLRQSHTTKAHDHVKIFKFSAKVNLLNRHREMSRWFWVVGLKPAVLQSEKSHLKLLYPCGCYTLFFSEWLVCLSRSHISNRLQINFGC